MPSLSDYHCGDGLWVDDVLTPNLTIVFCGTALGRVSAEKRAYYANKGNQFWATLHRIALTPHRIAPSDYLSALQHGIGLTDLCKTEYGQDAELSNTAFDRDAFEQKMSHFKPKLVAFTSKRAAAEYLGKRTGRISYGLQQETIGATQLYVLCSPSGLARRWWREEVWRALPNYI